jgi:hypothetical protein
MTEKITFSDRRSDVAGDADGFEEIAVYRVTLQVKKQKGRAPAPPPPTASASLVPLPVIADRAVEAVLSGVAEGSAPTWQWLRDGVEKADETSPHLIPALSDAGALVSCRVTAGDVTVESDAHEVLAIPVLTELAVVPDAGEADTVFIAVAQARGHPEPEILLQWVADGVEVEGATGATFAGAEAGSVLQVRAVARNAVGEAVAISDPVQVAGPASGPRGPEAVAAWSAGPGDEPGTIYAEITSLPHPGDATRRDDGLGEITGADIQLGDGPWRPLEPLAPEDLPLLVLVRMSRPDTLWQDAAGSIPARDGDPVRRIDDARGTGTFLLTQGQPVYRHLHGRHWLEADGVDDQIDLPLDTVRNRAGLTVITAFNCSHAGGSGNLFRSTFSGNNLWLRTRVHNGVLNAGGRRRVGDALVSHDVPGVAGTGRDLVFSALFDIANARLSCRVDGSEVLSVAHQTPGRTDDTDASSVDLIRPNFAGRFYGGAVGPLLTPRQAAAIEDAFARDMEILP